MTLDGRCAKQIIGRAGIMPHTLRTQAYGVGSTPHARNSSPAEPWRCQPLPKLEGPYRRYPWALHLKCPQNLVHGNAPECYRG